MAGKSYDLERAAEAHFMIRPMLVRALKDQKIVNHEVHGIDPSLRDYYDLWHSHRGEAFHDMTTMIRLGSAIEVALKAEYMRLKGYATLTDLKADPAYKQNAFQRIQPWHAGPSDAQAMLLPLGTDLNANSMISKAREVMLHRHLYAHLIGLVDQRYIDDWNRLTSENILPSLGPNYPAQDVYWFRPCARITDYINELRVFIRDL